MRRSPLMPAVMALLLLGACGGEESRQAEGEKQGRDETRSIRNTEAVGYPGEAIADKVDDALEKTEERERRTEEEIRQQAE